MSHSAKQNIILMVFSVVFVNKNDDTFHYSSRIEEDEEFDTVICHGSEYKVYISTNDGEEIEYTAEEFAKRITNSASYSGKDIKLVSCNTGAKDDGFAQQLANILGVKVLAPTEAIWLNVYGELFISDYEALADMWFDGESVNETGTWREFLPQKGAVND